MIMRRNVVMSLHRGADKAVCVAARKRRQSMHLGNGRQASATVPGPEERHRCFGPFEQAAQCKRDDHATNRALCPGVLIVGSVVTSVLVPATMLAAGRPPGGLRRGRVVFFRAQKKTWPAGPEAW